MKNSDSVDRYVGPVTNHRRSPPRSPAWPFIRTLCPVSLDPYDPLRSLTHKPGFCPMTAPKGSREGQQWPPPWLSWHLTSQRKRTPPAAAWPSPWRGSMTAHASDSLPRLRLLSPLDALQGLTRFFLNLKRWKLSTSTPVPRPSSVPLVATAATMNHLPAHAAVSVCGTCPGHASGPADPPLASAVFLAQLRSPPRARGRGVRAGTRGSPRIGPPAKRRHRSCTRPLKVGIWDSPRFPLLSSGHEV